MLASNQYSINEKCFSSDLRSAEQSFVVLPLMHFLAKRYIINIGLDTLSSASDVKFTASWQLHIGYSVRLPQIFSNAGQLAANRLTARMSSFNVASTMCFQLALQS